MTKNIFFKFFVLFCLFGLSELLYFWILLNIQIFFKIVFTAQSNT